MGMVATSAHSSQLFQTDPTRAGGAVTCGGMLSIYPQACASCVRPLTVCMGGAHCGDAPEPLPTGGRGRGSARIPHPSDGTSAEAWLKPYEPTRVVCRVGAACLTLHAHPHGPLRGGPSSPVVARIPRQSVVSGEAIGQYYVSVWGVPRAYHHLACAGRLSVRSHPRPHPHQGVLGRRPNVYTGFTHTGASRDAVSPVRRIGGRMRSCRWLSRTPGLTSHPGSLTAVV
jgi:hypothetical protein